MSILNRCEHQVYRPDGSLASRMYTRRCANKPLTGSSYCHLHQPEKVEARERKQAERKTKAEQRRLRNLSICEQLKQRHGIEGLYFLPQGEWQVDDASMRRILERLDRLERSRCEDPAAHDD